MTDLVSRLNEGIALHLAVTMSYRWTILLAVLRLSSSGLVVEGRGLDREGPQKTGGKIFGGTNAARQDYRYNVWIRLDNVAVCGGTLIAEEWVLTAASCVNDEPRTRKYRVFIGDYNRVSENKEFKVRPLEFFIHPNFNPVINESNIALIQLSKPAPVQRKTIDLVPRLATADLDADLVNATCYMTGWGQNQDRNDVKRLQILPVTIENSNTCIKLNEETREICYAGAPGGGCPTDLGDPVMCLIDGVETQVGINLGISCNADKALATRISAFNSWIDGIINPEPTTSQPPTTTTPTQPTSCGLPPTVDNGMIVIDGSEAGDKGRVICDDSYRISLPTVCDSEITCQPDGTWSNLAATCVQVCESAGTSFMFGYLRNAFAEGTLYLYVVATGPTTLTIQVPFLTSEDTVLEITEYAALQFASSLAGTADEEQSNKGVYVTSVSPVTVYAHSYRPGNGPSADGTLILPESCLSMSYRVAAHNAGPTDSLLSAMMVVATVDNTQVQITGPSGTKNVALNRFGTYYLRGQDFTGTLVTSSSNIAVLAGHECGNVPNQATQRCDHLIEQIPPVMSLETSYIVTNFSPRPSYSVRIVAAFDQTNVTLWDSMGIQIASISLNSGQSDYRTFSSSHTIAITSNKGILVSQYSHGAFADSFDFGDPSMVVLPGLNQFLNSYRVYKPNPPTLYNQDWVTVILSTCYNLTGLRINGAEVPSSGVQTITAPNIGTYAIFHVELSSASNTISHTDPLDIYSSATFGVVQYGFNNLVEYAWVAGRSFAAV